MVSPNDEWIGADSSGGGPAVITCIHGPRGLVPTSVSLVGDNLAWTYSLTVPAGQTVELGYFTIVAATPAGAIAAASALVAPTGFSGHAADYLSSADLASLANFSFYTATAVTFTTSLTGTYGQSVTATACLTAGGQPLPNKVLTFLLDGTTMGTATTDAAGTAILPNISLAGLPVGTYSGGLSVNFAGDATYWESSATTNLTVTPVAKVAAMLVENGLTERSYVDQLTIGFNEPVTTTAAIPVTLTNLGTQGDLDEPVALSASQFQWTAAPGSGDSVLTWSLESFAGGTTSLPDGYYELCIPDGIITDGNGAPLDGDGDGQSGGNYVADFFVLQGNVNGDGVVNQQDMSAVNAVLGSRPGSSNWNPNADLNRDGRVTTSDRIIVFENTGHAIVPPGEPGTQVTPAVAESLPAWSFDSSALPETTNDLPGGSPVGGVTFEPDAGAMLLDGSAVELGGNIVNLGPNVQTIDLPLTLIGNQTIDTEAGDVAISGDIDQSGGGFGVTKTGPGTVSLSGTNSYSGGTTVLAGVLQFASSDALPSAGSLTIGAGGIAVFGDTADAAAATTLAAPLAAEPTPASLAPEATTVTTAGVMVPATTPLASSLALQAAATPFNPDTTATAMPAALDTKPAAATMTTTAPSGPLSQPVFASPHAHDAVFQSIGQQPAVDAAKAAAFWEFDSSRPSGQANAQNDSIDRRVDAVMALLERM